MIKLQLLKIHCKHVYTFNNTLQVLITCKYFQIVMMVSFKFDQVPNIQCKCHGNTLEI